MDDNINSLLFSKLTKKRRELANQLNEHAAKGIWNMVIDKYSESAHFILELLQNADDSLATEVDFSINNNDFLFYHNGKIKFSISDPDLEDEGNIGHINAITSIGASTKTESDKIGKFGIGFKSVFQYTDTPFIQDENFCFYIENYIVPIECNHKIENLSNDKTLFKLPLKNDHLVYELNNAIRKFNVQILFLNNISTVTLKYKVIDCECKTIFSKKEIERIENKNFTYQCVELQCFRSEENQIINSSFYLFSKKIADTNNVARTIQIAFKVCNNKLVSINESDDFVYYYFPTKDKSSLHFLINAPFVITDNRELIKRDNNWNKFLLDELSNLYINALEFICKEKKLTFYSIFDIIPSKKVKNEFVFFYDFFFNKTIEKLKTINLFSINKNEFVDVSKVIVPDNLELSLIFKREYLFQLDKILKEFYWLFSNDIDEDNKKSVFVYNYLKNNNITKNLVSIDNILDLITIHFFYDKEIEWLNMFYHFLAKNLNARIIEKLKHIPFLINSDGAFVSPFNNENMPQIFLDNENVSSRFDTISEKLKCNEDILFILDNLNIKKPEPLNEIETFLSKKYSVGSLNNYEFLSNDWNFILNCYEEIKFDVEKCNRLISVLSKMYIIPVKNEDKTNYFTLCLAKNTYIENKYLRDYFNSIDINCFVDNSFIERTFIPEKRDLFYNLYFLIGGNNSIKFYKTIIKPTNKDLEIFDLHPVSLRKIDNGAQEIENVEIDSLSQFFKEMSQKKSQIFFNILAQKVKQTSSYMLMKSLLGKYIYIELGKHKYTECSFQRTSAYNSIFYKKWLFNSENELVTPSEIKSTKDLLDIYDFSQKDIFFFLGIKIEENVNILSERQKRALKIINSFEELGFSMEFLENKIEELKKVNY